MTETTDRQDAVPAATPAPEAAALDEREAITAIDSSADSPAVDATEPDDVVATAVLVADEEFVVLPAAEPQADAPPELEAYRPDEAPLLDSELEEGIANIFATLHSATSDELAEPDEAEAYGAVAYDAEADDADADDPEADDADAEVDAEDDFAAVDMSTFRLLGELDRLWHRAA